MKDLTLVIGASENPERYSNLAVRSLQQHGFRTAAIGNRPGNIEGTPIQKGEVALQNVDTVTLYLNPANQQAYYTYILSLQPRRIIFNPGTENPELMRLAQAKGIECLPACTLVLLSTGQY
jgi:predicted CoA-binding protein